MPVLTMKNLVLLKVKIMFDFNEELFINASNKVEDALAILLDKKQSIDRLNTISNHDFKNDVNIICSNIKAIQKDILELSLDINKTKKTLNLISTDDFSILNLKNLFPFLYGASFDAFCLTDYEYGANQGFVTELFDRYITDPESLSEYEQWIIDEVFKQFQKIKYKRYDENYIAFILESAKNGGCGIAANANVIVSIYSSIPDGERKFYDKYGFPLYYEEEDGTKHTNFNLLFTQLYLNSVSYDITYDLFFDISNRPYVPLRDDILFHLDVKYKNYGLVPKLIEAYLTNELADDFSIDVEIIYRKTGVGVYQSNIDNYDYCMICAHGFCLKPYDDAAIKTYGTDEQDYKGGHCMFITGISENGNLLVSSWGVQFELTSYGRGDFIFVGVEEKNGN